MHLGNRMSVLLLLHGKDKGRESDKVPIYVLYKRAYICLAQQYQWNIMVSHVMLAQGVMQELWSARS